MSDTRTIREILAEHLDSMPHYVIGIDQGPGPQWHSQAYPNRAAAEKWLDGYRVAQAYKDAHYRIVRVEEYHGGRVTRVGKNSRRNPAAVDRS